MPHGSRILLLSALTLAGCQSASKTPAQPVRATVLPGERAALPSGRSDTASPVVKNADFQKKIDTPPLPKPDAMPSLGVPALPTTGTPQPVPIDPIPPTAPGLSGAPQPPIAESSGTGGLVMPSLFEKK